VIQRVGDLLGSAVERSTPVGGGCVSDARRVELADGRSVFAKLAAPEVDLEAEGLRWLAEPGAPEVGVPAVLGVDSDAGIIVLEWIEPGRPSARTGDDLGWGLARIHAAGAPAFGWRRDGVIGTLPQDNSPAADWPTFYSERRLRPMARAAADGGALPGAATDLVEQVCERLPELAGPAEPPARVHGDLWSGNVHVGLDGRPWLVDPAAHGAHREVDLAMLDLFGGLEPRLTDAYEEVHPLAPGWRDRLGLWQLWPLLVHVVLFGTGYVARTLDTLRRYA
jgi:fructosamine-3-kinase